MSVQYKQEETLQQMHVDAEKYLHVTCKKNHDCRNAIDQA